MCLGIPGRVVADAAALHRDVVTVDVAGVHRPVNAGLLDEPLEPGDWVLVHMGFALARLSPEEAEEAMGSLRSLGAERALANGEPVPAEEPW